MLRFVAVRDSAGTLGTGANGTGVGAADVKASGWLRLLLLSAALVLRVQEASTKLAFTVVQVVVAVAGGVGVVVD